MTEKQKITKRFIDSLPFPESGQKIYQDRDLRGFAIRVTPTKKAFIINRKFKGALIRHKFAEYPSITVEQARIKASEIISDLMSGINPKDKLSQQKIESITLDQAFEDYIKTKDLKPKTIKDYQDLMRLQLSIWKDKRLTDIKRNMVLESHKRMSERSKARADLAMRLLRAIFYFSQAKYRLSNDAPLILENPVLILSEVKVWNKVKRRKRMISIQELSIWHDSLMSLEPSPKNNFSVTRDFLLFVLFTGLRRKEAATLKWDQISLRRKTFTVMDTKNHNEHTLPLSDYLLTLLKKRKKENPEGFLYVFPDKNCETFLQEPKSFIKRVIAISDIKFSTHDLRRTFTTIAESLDIPHYALKRLLNHNQANDVTAGYIVDDVERLRKPMEKITAHLKKLLILPVDKNIKSSSLSSEG